MSILELTPPPRGRSRRTRQRDQRTSRAVRRLKEIATFRSLPSQVLKGYAALFTLSEEVRQQLDERGLVGAEGDWSPGIDIFRRLKDSEAKYLSIMIELAGQERDTAKPVLDINDLRDDPDGEKAAD